MTMKGKCWKEIQNQLCPPEKWVKDSQQKKCLCCCREFTIFRRRHHCRFCGNIFCSDCSDFFFNGQYLNLIKEKQVRHCQLCHKRIEKLVKEWSKIPQIQEEEAKELSDEEEDNFNLNRFFDENQKTQKDACETSEDVNANMKRILDEASDALCDKFVIEKKHWKDKLAQLAIKGAIETKMEVLASEGSIENAMDIARQVRIKLIETESSKAIQVMVKGIVVEKNLPIKNMITKQSHPRVLIVENSIDIDSLSSFFKFEELVKNEKSIMKKILEKVVKLNPDIIFVGQTVSVYALQFFQSQRINVISKMKQKDLEAIQQLAGIRKVVKYIWQVEKHRPQNIIGKCDKIYFKEVKEKQVLMFLECDIGIRTIILGEESDEYLSSIKKSFQILVRLARQINLQKYLIMVDVQHQVRRQNFPLRFELSKNFYSNFQAFILLQEISFSKITFNLIKLSNSSKLFQEYAAKTSLTQYKDICKKVDYAHKKIYTNDDITLGGYILLAVANFQRHCKVCDNNHFCESYYMGNKKISIRLSKKQNVKTSFIEVFDEEELTLQKLKSYLNKQKQIVTIETYISCLNCDAVVGKGPTKVGKLYLSNSFHYFLYLMTEAPFKARKQSEKNSLTMSRKGSHEHCSHQMLARVFEYENFIIKVIIKEIQTVKIDYINLKDEWSINNIIQKENEFIKNTYCSQLVEKVEVIERINLQIQSLPIPMNSNFSTLSASFSNTIDAKIISYFQQYVHIKEILDRLKVQVAEIQNQGNKQLIKLKHDWTTTIRRFLKVDSVLEMALQIMSELAKALRKKKFDESLLTQTVTDLPEKETLLKNQLDESMDLSTTSLTNISQNVDTVSTQYLQTYVKGIKKKRFPKVKGVFLGYFVPLIYDPISILASGLNSGEYGKIMEDQTTANSSEVNFKISYHKKIKTDWSIRTEIEKMYTQIIAQVPQKSQICQFTIHYPRQFEELRKQENITNDLFVRSLCTCKGWESSGGKTNSMFAKAQNDMLVVKVINEKEFQQFLKFVKDYLQYIKKNSNTFLAKIFGIFEITVRGKMYKCVVMQNLFFGLQGNMKVYDLKGSQVNRLNMPPEKGGNYTGQDTNFKIDRNGQPFILESGEYDKTLRQLQEDSSFLKDHSVIDYSLLVITKKNYLRLGIIDYMRPYHLIQKLQTIYKQIKSGRDPTVIPPASYAERFVSAMKKYFIKSI